MSTPLDGLSTSGTIPAGRRGTPTAALPPSLRVQDSKTMRHTQTLVTRPRPVQVHTFEFDAAEILSMFRERYPTIPETAQLIVYDPERVAVGDPVLGVEWEED